MKIRSAFVRNETKPAPALAVAKLQKFTFNFSTQASRLETLEGREHIAIPMVMLLEGVHGGSDGALYYPNDELSKTPAVWNHKPIVVYHPEQNGVGVSACDPAILNTRKVGLIMNTRFSQGRLTAEAWIEKPRAEAVDKRVSEAITKNEMMELSTGVFVDVEPTEGTWNGEEYQGVARNLRPDHLALLPDLIGACSIADGAGFIRNQAKKGKLNPTKLLKNAVDYISRRWGLTSNEMSMDNVQCALQSALQARFSPNMDEWLYVADVYSNFVIYDYQNQLFRLGYTTSDTGVTLSEDKPVEVNRVTEYRTVDGAFVGNKDQPKDTTMNTKAQMILAILAAGAACGWSEADRPMLDKLTDNQVKSIHDGLTKNTTAPAPVIPATPPAAPPPATPAPAAVAPATNAQPAPQPANVIPGPKSFEEWMAAAPAQFQAVIRNGQEMLNVEKARLVGAITRNQNNPYTVDQLNAMEIPTLRALAQLAGGALNGQPALAPAGISPDYWGQAPVTENAANDQEALALPSMDFTPAGAKK